MNTRTVPVSLLNAVEQLMAESEEYDYDDGLALILLFAGFQVWLFAQVDRALERVETRRVITLQDLKTKQKYACYVSKEKR